MTREYLIIIAVSDSPTEVTNHEISSYLASNPIVEDLTATSYHACLRHNIPSIGITSILILELIPIHRFWYNTDTDTDTGISIGPIPILIPGSPA